ncbi:PREDICTED: zinc finger protein 226 isoform X2 [Nicrophorus vespilloides]|uniref:Zinc finger protein 226 isoform X2 n=1 Tax=Nicrophorus vespilloides TaxID=110193 RepID=A0ABM1MF06_NICVS|nr:PREDICTED: zinc finger protein 226 isoform X2 [Nicrophorus vespilloides]
MEGGTQTCPVCTLYLRPGISLKEHLTSHPKQKVIEALVKLSNVEPDRQIATASSSIQPGTSQQQWNLPMNAQPMHANHSFIYQQFMSSTTPQPNVLGVNHLGQQYVTIPTVFNPQMMCPPPPYMYQQQQEQVSTPTDDDEVVEQQLHVEEGEDVAEVMHNVEDEEVEEEEEEDDLDNSKKEMDGFEVESDIKETVIIQGDTIIEPGQVDLNFLMAVAPPSPLPPPPSLIPHPLPTPIDVSVENDAINYEKPPNKDLNKSCQTTYDESDIFIDKEDIVDDPKEDDDDEDEDDENREHLVDEEDEEIDEEEDEDDDEDEDDEDDEDEDEEEHVTTANYITLINHEEAMVANDENAAQHNNSMIMDMDGMNLMINSDVRRPAAPTPVEDFDYINRYDRQQTTGPKISIHENGDESVSVDSANIRADEHMPPRGELSGQESNASDVPWSRMQYHEGNSATSTSYNTDVNVQDGWDGSSDMSNCEVPPLQSRVPPAYEEDEDDDDDVPTISGCSNSGIQYKCSSCEAMFNTVKDRVAHQALKHPKDRREEETKVVKRRTVKKLVLKSKKAGVKAENTFDNVFTNKLNVEENKADEEPVKLESATHNTSVASVVVNPTVCTICDAVVSDNTALQQHLSEVHNITNEERYKCSMCKEVFANESKYTAHLAIHPLECRLCGKFFYRRQNLQLHMKRHLGIRPYKCTVCDKSFLTRQKLEEHKNIHTGDSPIKCNLCDETFRRHSNLVQHKNRHHFNVKKKVKDYICTCGEIFHSKRKLAWHKEVHDNKPKACPYCSAKFIHASSLTRHVRRAHNDRFVPKEERSNENVQCPICNGVFLRASLDVHIKNHSGIKQFRCLICSKDFTTKWNLKLHKWTHAARAAKPFKCELCKGAFIRETDYTAHMNSHKSIRPYTCNYCGAQFNRKYNCQRHVKEHVKVKNFNCQICGKSFHRSYYLKDHMRIHSGDRPYACHICGKSSNSKSNHNKHVKTHHAREPVSTEI